MQNLKQQLKSWEQNSPSHMQMVQQQPFSLLGDPDMKLQQLPGFDQDRQQLAAAMAGDSLDDCLFACACRMGNFADCALGCIDRKHVKY